MVKERVAAAPLVAWVNDELDRLSVVDFGVGDRGHGAQGQLAKRLGIDEGQVRRWKDGRDGNGDLGAETYPRKTVEEALDRGDVPIWELYPDLYQDPAMEDAYCRTCREIVTVGSDGACPWCETPTDERMPTRERAYCANCERAYFPNNDGTCWNCGQKTVEIPWVECECGCGRMTRLFDAYGRGPIRFVRGHGRISEYKDRVAGQLLDPEPFAQVIEQVIANIDVVSAVARELGIARQTVLHVLNRRGPVRRKDINRALWFLRRGGKGGRGRSAYGDFTIPSFRDLYGMYKCPGCGGRKGNPSAELCKKCRIAKNREEGKRPPTHRRRISNADLLVAKQVWESTDNMRAAARAVYERTGYSSVDSCAVALRDLKERGWPPSETEESLREAA